MYYESEGRDGDDNDDNNDNDDNDGSLLVEQYLLFRKMERKEREACSHPVYRAPHTYMYLNSLSRFLLSLSVLLPLSPSPLSPSPSPSPSPFSTQVQSEARLLAAQKEQVSISSFLNVSPALQNKHMQTTLATVEVVSVVRLQDFSDRTPT